LDLEILLFQQPPPYYDNISYADIPITVYYAYKQSENDSEDKTASTGWETMLSAIIWLLTQQLTHAMEKYGVVGAAKIVADIFTSEPEHAKALAYRLFTIAERKGCAAKAYAYNSLVIAWSDVQAKAAELLLQSRNSTQISIFETEGN